MALGVVALEPAKMVGRGTVRQAIGVARRDIEGIQDAQTVLQITDAGRQLSGDGRRQIAPGAPEAVAPRLLAMAEVQTLQGLLHGLVAGEAGPFMVAGGGAHSGQLQIGLRLMQPVSGTIHPTIVMAEAGSTAGPAEGTVLRARKDGAHHPAPEGHRGWNLQAMA
jgi:hypothetical protein